MKEAIWLRLYLLVMVCLLYPLYILALSLGLVRIKGWDLRKFFPGENGLITYSNHVTNVETILIPLSLAPFFIIWTRLLICSVAKKKWYNKPYFRFVKPAAIPISPGEGLGAEESMKGTIAFLKRSKKIVHIYPSGTRLQETKKANKAVKRRGGREIGRFYPGILVVLAETKRDLLPIWIEKGKWPRSPLITIIFGEKRISFASLNFPDKRFSEFTAKDKEEQLEKLEDALLET